MGRGRRPGGCAEWGSVFLTPQSRHADVPDILGQASIKDLALEEKKKVRAKRAAGPRPSDGEEGGNSGGGQRAQAPFILPRARITSPPSSLLLGVVLN